jgi:O-antigen ligase
MVAWKMFLDRPLLGCGFGHYRDEFVYYLDDRSTDLPLEKARPYVQHNVFLALLAEIGLIGMGLFIAMLSLWTRDAWRLWRAAEAPLWARQQGLLFLAMLGSYFTNAMFHDLSIIPMVNMFLFFMAGLTSNLSWRAQSAAAARPAPAATSTVTRRGGYASA